jgi:hypothetical protein
MLDADEDGSDEFKIQPILENLAYFGPGNNPKLAKDALIEVGFKVLPHGM